MDWMQFVTTVAIPVAALIMVLADRLRTGDKKDTTELRDEMRAVKTDIESWKLEVIRTYVTRAEMDRIEARIVAQFERFESKLEKLFSKTE